MLIKRKRSVILLLVFIFTVSLLFSQLWMLMTRYDIEDVFTSNSNRIRDVYSSLQYRRIIPNISATINKDHQFVESSDDNLFRRHDDLEYVTDAAARDKLKDDRNNALDNLILEAIISERITTISRWISNDPIEELRNGNSSQTEKSQKEKKSSGDDFNLLTVPKIKLLKKPISDNLSDKIEIVNLNRSSEHEIKRSYSSTTTAVRNSNMHELKKNEEFPFAQKPVFNRRIHSNNTFENQELYWQSKIPSESEEFHKDISRDDFAADDLAIRGNFDQIGKFVESTTHKYPAVHSARIKNKNYTIPNFTEDNFGAISNFEHLVPLPTKSLGESEDDADLHKESNDVPRSRIKEYNVPKSPGINVVSMSLYGSDVRYTMGALRNAEMIRRNFPGWTLRIYTESAASSPRHGLVPANVVQSLRRLGAEIQYVMPEQDFIPPMMWRFLVADDISVDRFIVRDTDSRLTARDAAAVAAWIRSDKPFHSIRDHPSHAAYAVSGGMWGGKTTELRDILRRSWIDVMRGLAGDYFRDMSFLNDIIWPRVKQHAYCSDSVSCDRWPNSFPFPVRRRGTEHVGQVYDEHDVGREGDVRILRAAGEYGRCLPDGR